MEMAASITRIIDYFYIRRSGRYPAAVRVITEPLLDLLVDQINDACPEDLVASKSLAAYEARLDHINRATCCLKLEGSNLLSRYHSQMDVEVPVTACDHVRALCIEHQTSPASKLLATGQSSRDTCRTSRVHWGTSVPPTDGVRAVVVCSKAI